MNLNENIHSEKDAEGEIEFNLIFFLLPGGGLETCSGGWFFGRKLRGK